MCFVKPNPIYSLFYSANRTPFILYSIVLDSIVLDSIVLDSIVLDFIVFYSGNPPPENLLGRPLIT